MRSKVTAGIAIALVVAAMPGPQLAGPMAQAATPSHGTLTAPDIGTVRLQYRGTVPPGSGSLAACANGVNADLFTLTLKGLGSAFYRTHKALLVAHIEWKPNPGTTTSGGGSDLALVVAKDGNVIGSSDGGANEETVPVDHPDGAPTRSTPARSRSPRRRRIGARSRSLRATYSGFP